MACRLIQNLPLRQDVPCDAHHRHATKAQACAWRAIKGGRGGGADRVEIEGPVGLVDLEGVTRRKKVVALQLPDHRFLVECGRVFPTFLRFNALGARARAQGRGRARSRGSAERRRQGRSTHDLPAKSPLKTSPSTPGSAAGSPGSGPLPKTATDAAPKTISALAAPRPPVTARHGRGSCSIKTEGFLAFNKVSTFSRILPRPPRLQSLLRSNWESWSPTFQK